MRPCERVHSVKGWFVFGVTVGTRDDAKMLRTLDMIRAHLFHDIVSV